MGHVINRRTALAAVLGVVAGAAGELLLADAFRAKNRPPEKVYVVQRVHWAYADRAEPLKESEPGGAGFPDKVFSDPAAAEAHRRERDREARRGRCPFEHGRGWGRSFPALNDFTGVPTGEFIDWLRAAGLAPPAVAAERWQAAGRGEAAAFDQKSFDAWRLWWDERFRSREGEPDCDKVWDKLDRVRFYDVVEVGS